MHRLLSIFIFVLAPVLNAQTTVNGKSIAKPLNLIYPSRAWLSRLHLSMTTARRYSKSPEGKE